MKKEQKESVIEEVMQNFDFEKAHAYMVINDEWFYNDGEKYRPTVEDVKKMARELLEYAFKLHQKFPDFLSTTRYNFTAAVTDEDMELMYHPITSTTFADNV
jgi:hypothetical protein